VDPHLATILITGFPSRDLQAELGNSGIREMLEKTFDLEDLSRAVADAALHQEEAEAEPSVGAAVLEIDAEGEIVFASQGARALIAETGKDADDIRDLLGEDFAPRLDAALQNWSLESPSGAPTDWKIRSRLRRSGSGWLVAVCPADEPRWLSDPRLRILLDHHGRSAPLLPGLGPVIVLESDEALRRLLASQIERIGALCYVADGIQAALRLLAAEPRTACVIIDVGTAAEQLSFWVQSIHMKCPGARVVGTGAEGSADKFLSQGLDRLLEMPWRIDELVAALTD
jgi:DNA-binding NtrC family response regulator